MRSVEKELLPVMRALAVLLTSGVGLETAMKKTGDLEQALQQVGGGTNDNRLKTLISILAGGTGGRGDTVRSLDELAYREMNRKQEEIDGFIGRLSIMKEITLASWQKRCITLWHS